jgi:hypothetical protein
VVEVIGFSSGLGKMPASVQRHWLVFLLAGARHSPLGLRGREHRRRGEILNFSSDKGRCQIHAYVPLAELFGYTSDLRNVTSGTASFTMEPSHYAPVKEELADLRAAS